jgi:hypothetical protein
MAKTPSNQNTKRALASFSQFHGISSVDEGEETGLRRFLSLKTSETWIVYVCHSEGEWARQNI